MQSSMSAGGRSNVRNEIRDANGILCHLVFHPSTNSGRIDLTEVADLLQVASIAPEDGASFRPHYHIPKPVESSEVPTMESWVILQGEVTVHYFDESQVLLESIRLGQGDITLTFRGGHGYSDASGLVAVEFKSGPYLGQLADKKFL